MIAVGAFYSFFAGCLLVGDKVTTNQMTRGNGHLPNVLKQNLKIAMETAFTWISTLR